MKTFQHNKVKFRAHDKGCAESFKEDRRHGLIYGPYAKEDGSLHMCAEDASMDCDFCVYCGEAMPRTVHDLLPGDTFHHYDLGDKQYEAK